VFFNFFFADLAVAGCVLGTYWECLSDVSRYYTLAARARNLVETIHSRYQQNTTLFSLRNWRLMNIYPSGSRRTRRAAPIHVPQHWICAFIDFERKYLTIFDSWKSTAVPDNDWKQSRHSKLFVVIPYLNLVPISHGRLLRWSVNGCNACSLVYRVWLIGLNGGLIHVRSMRYSIRHSVFKLDSHAFVAH